MRGAIPIGTTLNIDDDVLDCVKAVAPGDRKPVGEVVSAILRRAIEPAATPAPRTRNGIPLFPVTTNSRPVTPEIVRTLLEHEL